jgi:hypothetical protein
MSPAQRVFGKAAYLVLVAGSLYALTGCERAALDAQMATLCKVDGGTRIYEQVKLPPERFNANGHLVPLTPYQAGMTRASLLFGNEYTIEDSTQVIKAGEPFDRFFSEGRLLKHFIRIKRSSDGKLLGESVSYSRTGGEFVPWGRPSTEECPTASGNFLLAVFVKAS